MAPAAEAVLSGQGAQVEESVAAGSLLKVLGGHCVVLAVPAGVKEPRGQQRMEPGVLNWLAGQERTQAETPVWGLYLPAAQGEHDGAIEVALNEPGGQGVQLREVKLA